MRQNIFPEGLAKRVVSGRLLYSPVVTYEFGSHKMVLVSGLLARDADGAIVGVEDMAAQIRQVGLNLKTALAAAGADTRDLVRTATYVTDIDEFFRHVDARHEFLGESLPTSTTIEVSRLSHPDFMVEIEAMAIVPVPATSAH
jgi:2-iminobutanoate/2-iminopropanoate deaminase